MYTTKQPQWDVKGNRCIHDFPEPCKRVAYNAKTSGWLCKDHYYKMQNSIPPKPRQEQPKWKGLVPAFQTDEEIIADIIATDAVSITLGKVVRIKRGTVDPVCLRILEKVA